MSLKYRARISFSFLFTSLEWRFCFLCCATTEKAGKNLVQGIDQTTNISRFQSLIHLLCSLIDYRICYLLLSLKSPIFLSVELKSEVFRIWVLKKPTDLCLLNRLEAFRGYLCGVSFWVIFVSVGDLNLISLSVYADFFF